MGGADPETRWLVLGATGQIGNAVVDRLARSGAGVSVLVRDPGRIRFAPGIEVRTAPVFDAGAFRAALAGAGRVVYALGAPNQWARDKAFFAGSNVAVLEEFLTAMAGFADRRVAYVSTFEVFRPEGGRIREEAPVSEAEMPPSFDTMRKAYRLIREAGEGRGLWAVTVHPAAVYGGLDTAHGFTEYLLNLARGKWLRTPAVIECRFPVVHADSLADGIVRALEAGTPGSAYILSDGMTSLRGMAAALKAQYPAAYSPFTMPAPVARLNSALLEALSRHVTGRHPLISSDHLKFLLQGYEPDAAKAVRELGWKPMPLEEGIGRFLARHFPAAPR